MSMYVFGPFALDSEQLLLSVDGAPLALGPKVVETLLALVEHPGEVLSKSALLDRVWPEGYVEEANLAQNIYVLRKALHAHWERDAILTAPRRGYRFSGDVRSLRRAASAPVATAGTWWQRRANVALVVAASVILAFAAVASTTRAHDPAISPAPALSSKGTRLLAIGRYYWNQRTTVGVQKSLAYFARVVDTDPHDSRGYAALADANAIMGDYHYGAMPVKVYFARARAYARKALALDANSADAYAVLGMLETESNMSAKATARGLAELRRAIVLDPAYGPAHHWYGIALLNQGRVHEAMRELQTAANLDPLSVSTTAWLSSAAYLDRRYDEAIAYAHQTLDLSPSRVDVWQELGLAYEARGDYLRAIASFETLAAKCHMCAAESAALLAHAYAANHDLVRAHAELAKARSDRKHVSLEDLAVAQAAVGDRSGALALLRRASGDYSRKLIALDPRLDAFRDDVRFRSFIQSPS